MAVCLAVLGSPFSNKVESSLIILRSRDVNEWINDLDNDDDDNRYCDDHDMTSAFLDQTSLYFGFQRGQITWWGPDLILFFYFFITYVFLLKKSMCFWCCWLNASLVILILSMSAFADENSLKCDYRTNGKTKTCAEQYGVQCRPGIDELEEGNTREKKIVAGEQRTVITETCVWSRQLLRLKTAGMRVHLFGISSERRGREKRGGERSELVRRLGREWKVIFTLAPVSSLVCFACRLVLCACAAGVRSRMSRSSEAWERKTSGRSGMPLRDMLKRPIGWIWIAFQDHPLTLGS